MSAEFSIYTKTHSFYPLSLLSLYDTRTAIAFPANQPDLYIHTCTRIITCMHRIEGAYSIHCKHISEDKLVVNCPCFFLSKLSGGNPLVTQDLEEEDEKEH